MVKMVTYIIQDLLSNLYKIGRTSDFDKRFRNLSTGNIHLKPILLLEGDEERFLHQLYQNKHVKLEWYQLNSDDINDVRELIFDRKFA